MIEKDKNGHFREILKGASIHYAEGRTLLASSAHKVLRSENGGESWEEDGVVLIPELPKQVERFPLIKRIMRVGISTILPFASGARLCVANRMIFRAEPGSPFYSSSWRILRGSRPLNLCLTPNGNIYWGEYFLNLRRSKPIHVFCSRDEGRNWEVIHTFKKGSICHVHRIVYDPYDDALLISTGDRDHEVAILKTNKGFDKLTPLVRGNQLYRTTSLFPLPSCILYGTDNPSGENYVMALDRRAGSVDKIQELPGPVLYGCQVGQQTIFATMVEKQHHEASLWVGTENGFSLLTHFKTHKWNRAFRELAGYPTVILPEGKSSWPNLYCTPVGTEAYAHSLVRMDLSNVSKEKTA